MAIEIVDLPIYPLKIVIFHSYVSLPEGTQLCFRVNNQSTNSV
jgi:hypothetical protein